jgi:hypothetical protein
MAAGHLICLTHPAKCLVKLFKPVSRVMNEICLLYK